MKEKPPEGRTTWTKYKPDFMSSCYKLCHIFGDVVPICTNCLDGPHWSSRRHQSIQVLS